MARVWATIVMALLSAPVWAQTPGTSDRTQEVLRHTDEMLRQAYRVALQLALLLVLLLVAQVAVWRLGRSVGYTPSPFRVWRVRVSAVVGGIAFLAILAMLIAYALTAHR